MLPVRQERRKCVDFVAPLRGRKQSGDAARSRNLHNAISGGAENNCAVPVPRAAEDPGEGIADILRRAAGNVDLLQLASRLKCDEPAIRGPEDRDKDIFRAGQRVRFQRIKSTNPNNVAPVRYRAPERPVGDHRARK